MLFEGSLGRGGVGNMAMILVVDDSDLNLALLSTLLGRNGHQTRPVRSGQEAVEAIDNGCFDMVLCG